jgi:hypothetical protein
MCTSQMSESGVAVAEHADRREHDRADVRVRDVVRRRADAVSGEIPDRGEIRREREHDEQHPAVGGVEVQRERSCEHCQSLEA